MVADLRAESDDLDAIVADLPIGGTTPPLRRGGRSPIRSRICCGRIASR
jgi:hypothetical protein